MTINTPAIYLEELHKTYSKQIKGQAKVALKGISLSVSEGEAFGFVGPNGAGKSTTMKILTGSSFPTSGVASLYGIHVDNYQARAGVGYVPESPYLYDYLTPLETLLMACKLHNVSTDKLHAHCMMWLEKLGIASVANKQIRGFSKGMTQRTALASALVIKPKLLILDEPLSGLDPIGRKEIIDILMEYRKNGGTIFFSSHVLYDVERLADRFGLIHEGELKVVQSPSELFGGEQKFIVRSIGENALEGMQKDSGRRFFIEVEQSQLWNFLRKLEAENHQIIEVKSSLNLEAAFVRYITAN